MKVSIVIRALNERETLGRLLDDLERQDYEGEKEIIVVDNESVDGTPELAKERGARVITIKRNEFTYPRSMNAGVEAAIGEVVVLTVAHALPFRSDWLSSGLSHFRSEKVAGVYSPTIPHKNCSLAEIFFYYPNYIRAKLKGPHKAKPGMGIFGATNCAFRKGLWEQHRANGPSGQCPRGTISFATPALPCVIPINWGVKS